ncbi:MetQ/NlpA family ABC transporter substrate-binding protein [Sulfurospirillum arcachonense]|uniref:MetQ/NlpA family ABC transporter substrate-binding protein n=1 Tax=Sulfurospirillum arcachonense TaxID=57666 RepID=UPI000468E556|nr:MetQ/NlpA family ABC transporter substrate-binding protein [Sulfurospirillum arcachonense]
MKKSILKLTLGLSLIAGLSGIGANANDKVIRIGATPIPHVEILEQVKPILAKEGYTLEIKEFTDYVTPNLAVDDGDLDANFFQHVPYLKEFNKNKGTDLIKTVNVHLEPMGVYSAKIKNLKELKDGDSIAVPNDPTNENRALDVLENAGLLKFAKTDLKTKIDITENPRNFVIEEIDAPQLPRVLGDVAIAVINTNYALSANLNPTKDALAIESINSPYANIVVVKRGNENKAGIKALNKAINSEKIREFIAKKYKGAIIAAF